MNDMWIGFVGGAAAFAHCIGMCGGFVLHLADRESKFGRRAIQLMWHAGRAVTYVFLGAVAGFAGGRLASLPTLSWVQSALSYAAGLFMIVMGLALAGVVPLRFGSSRATGCAKETLYEALIGPFLGRPTPGGALGLGLVTGFLPCPVVMGFLAYAAQKGSVTSGILTMAALALGTVWSLFLLGLTGRMLTAWRRWGSVASAAVLILLGLATVLRGSAAFHHVLGCPRCETHSPAAPACCEGAAR